MQENARACHYMGICCYEGIGVNQNYEKAVEWFTLAAEQEHPESQYYLGVCYYNGQGVAEDRAKGLKFLRKAKSGGSVEAKKALVYLSE